MKEMTREWIKKAEEDFGVAGRELKANTGAYNVICYHAHQSMEKYFKAILQENLLEIKKIHDLIFLMEQTKAIIPEIKQYEDALLEIKFIAVEVRYPGGDADEPMAKKVYELAEKIRIIVMKKLDI